MTDVEGTPLSRSIWKLDQGDWSWPPAPAPDRDGRLFAAFVELLGAGADVNEPYDDAGWTPLHAAAYIGHLPAIERLLDAGARTDAEAAGAGGTPLAHALFWAHREVAERLAQVEVVPANLRIAAALGDLSLARDEGAGRGFVRPHDGFPAWDPSDGPQEVLDEALIWASANGRTPTVPSLLARGASVNAQVGSCTPLIAAATFGRVGTVACLLDAGADPERTTSHHQGRTAMHMAAWFDRRDTVRLLVQRGVPADTRDAEQHGTPMSWARHHRNALVVAYLALHARLDILDAAAVGRLELVEELVAADPTATATCDRDGDTPLHYAAYFGETPAIELLLRHGADRGAYNQADKTPLDIAREREHEAAEARLAAGL